MTQRRFLESRLALYDDLSGILGAMRSFALAELRRVVKREEAQQQIVQVLSEAWVDLAAIAPPANSPVYGDVWVLCGSVRGFCGSFNEDVKRAWSEEDAARCATVIVGERLASLVPSEIPVVAVAGAIGAMDASPAIDRILAALRSLAEDRLSGDFGLIVCLRDENGARAQRLLPLPIVAGREGNRVPLTNEAPVRVAAGVADHYLFHSLLALLLRSIRVENHMRLMQMENALRHLENGRDELQRQRNRLRQEEIVEEIEQMIGGRTQRQHDVA